jgi:hypothetical protein
LEGNAIDDVVAGLAVGGADRLGVVVLHLAHFLLGFAYSGKQPVCVVGTSPLPLTYTTLNIQCQVYLLQCATEKADCNVITEGFENGLLQ